MKEVLIKKQKEVAEYFISKINEAGFTAFAAGGAPRDWDHNMPAKDIDIFTDYKGKLFQFNNMFDLYNSQNMTLPAEYQGNPNLLNVYEYQYKHVKVQIIVVNNLNKLLSGFPLSISQVYYDTESKNSVGTVEYYESKATKVIKVTNIDHSHRQDYAERIMTKMKPLGYTLG